MLKRKFQGAELREIQHGSHPAEILKSYDLREKKIMIRGDVFTEKDEFRLLLMTDPFQQIVNTLQELGKIEGFRANITARKNNVVGWQPQEPIEGNIKVPANGVHFIERKLFIAPDPSVCAVFTNVKNIRDHIHHGQVIGHI
jgi:hypothetical protein